MRSLSASEAARSPSSFPSVLRSQLESLCTQNELTRTAIEHTQTRGLRLLDDFFESGLLALGYAPQRNVLVTTRSRFDIDLLISSGTWRAVIAIEGGKAARVDLDVLKFVAHARSFPSAEPTYAVLIVSDKRLLPTITGNGTESAFDYARRLFPLFAAAGSGIADLLVIEFSSSLPAETAIA